MLAVADETLRYVGRHGNAGNVFNFSMDNEVCIFSEGLLGLFIQLVRYQHSSWSDPRSCVADVAVSETPVPWYHAVECLRRVVRLVLSSTTTLVRRLPGDFPDSV